MPYANRSVYSGTAKAEQHACTKSHQGALAHLSEALAMRQETEPELFPYRAYITKKRYPKRKRAA